MEKYRLTRRGKFTVFFLSFMVFLVIATTIINISGMSFNYPGRALVAIAKVNSSSSDSSYIKLQTATTTTAVDESSEQLLIHKLVSNTNETLSIPVEKAYKTDGKKVAFLTFDDGPLPSTTPKILEILSNYRVKASFFLIGSLAHQNQDIVRDIASGGHAIGIHTYTHKYEIIYDSVKNFMDEVKKTDETFKDILGKEFQTRLVRFPGGSGEPFKKPYKQALTALGYSYIDWNCVIGDAESSDSAPPQALLNRLKETAEGKEHLVILLHDSASKQTTVQALPEIIEYLQGQGYEFAVLK